MSDVSFLSWFMGEDIGDLFVGFIRLWSVRILVMYIVNDKVTSLSDCATSISLNMVRHPRIFSGWLIFSCTRTNNYLQL